jgi:predicted permease
MADGTYVSAEYFSTLGIRPVAGRFFAEDDDRLDASATIVLTRAFAGARFGGPEAAIGQSIRLNDVPFTVVGVTSDDFHGLDPSRNPVFFVPLATGPLFWDTGSAANSAEMRVDARDYWVNAVGRLRNGISRTQAETILAQRFDAFARSSVESNAQLENLPSLSLLDAGNGTDVLRVRYRAPLYVLAAMVVLILAVACANIAGLLMSRATARRREMAVRLSVGAGRWRVIRQLLTESVMLAGAGGLAGIILSFWGMQLVATLLLASEPNFTLRPELNWIVLGFTALVSIATGVLFGLAPAVEATRVDLATALKGARSRGVVAGRPGRLPGFGSSLMVLQIALSLLLLVGAGLFARTLSNLRNTELGFENENLLLANVATRGSDYTGDRLKTFYTDLRRRLLEIPGVEGANSARPDLPSKLCYRDRQSIVW